MRKENLVKHLKRDYIFSAVILFFLTQAILILIFSFIVEKSDKTVIVQLLNIAVSAFFAFFVTKRYYKKFDIFLHKYVHKSRI